ncbi:MAG TPA: SagB/ThcOx family dehydrogenase, partial [Terriglobales bacterium]|nr:SagB/ThcOx family dehydrogenase [Terriglobales bacterium]
ISEPAPSSNADSIPGVQDLARLLYFSAGITKERAYPGGEIYFRAAACTGALYEIELYVVTEDLPGLDAGVYHFNPADVSLQLLRKGDFRGNLAHATAMEIAVPRASATIICTGTYWRNAWKYQARTYRHFGWDNGTLLANMLAVAAASGLPAEVVLGFVDAEVNRLLDLNTQREVSLCLVPILATHERQECHLPARDWQGAETQITAGSLNRESAARIDPPSRATILLSRAMKNCRRLKKKRRSYGRTRR